MATSPHAAARPERLVLAVGTATEVGKTWFGAATLGELSQRGIPVAARKPVQSADEGDPHPSDAAVLAAATGEAADRVCPPHRSLQVAMAPPMAADRLGLPRILLGDLAAEIEASWPANPTAALGWVESVGGVRSPIAHNGDSIDLVAALEPDVIVLVTDASLGVLNDVRLSHGALAPLGVPVIVALNRFDASDDLHRRNLAWLADRDFFDIVTNAVTLADRLSGDDPFFSRGHP